MFIFSIIQYLYMGDELPQVVFGKEIKGAWLGILITKVVPIGVTDTKRKSYSIVLTTPRVHL